MNGMQAKSPSYHPREGIHQQQIKLKDKEIATYAGIINTLKKQNEILRQKLEHKEGFARVLELEDKLKEAERKNQELSKEVKSMQRI